MPLVLTALGWGTEVVKDASLKYEYVNPLSEPVIIEGAVRSTVPGSHIREGFVMVITGTELSCFTVTGLSRKQPSASFTLTL